MAPAFDLTCSPGLGGGEHSTSVLGYGKDITRAQLIDLGNKADLKERDAANVIERAQAAMDKWEIFASEYGVGRKSADIIATALDKVGL